MADRVAKLVLTFDGEAGTIDSVLAQIKGSVRNAVADLERTTSKVELFANLETKVKASAEALFDASTKVKLLNAELDRTAAAGGKATPELLAGLKAANAELKTAEAAYNRNVDAITKQHNALTRLGIDTSNAARAQIQLTAATREAAAAAELQAAKQSLTLKTLSDVQPQIQKLQVAYNTLRDSGKLSANEIAIAQVALRERTRELNAQVSTLGSSFKAQQADVTSFFTTIQAKALGVIAVAGTLAHGFHEVTAAAHEFENGLAKISSVTTLTHDQLAALGDDARSLARALGLDLPEVLKSLFDLIRSGVSPENAITILRVSAEAAKASFTDLGSGVKASQLLIHGFGVDAKDLAGALDLVVKGAQLGGPTLTEFANGGGHLVSVAKALRVPLDEVVAALAVMTKTTGDAEGSISTLTKILIKLGEPSVRGKLRELGIDSSDLVEVFQRLGDVIPVSELIALGIATTKTVAGVTALTNASGQLAPTLDKLKDSAGTIGKSLAVAFDTPAERAKRLDAAVHDLSVTMGEAVGSGSRFAVVLTSILNVFNNLAPAVKRAVAESALLSGLFSGTAFGPYASWLGLINQSLAMYASRQKAAAEATKTSNDALQAGAQELLKANEAGISKAREDLDAISARLLQTQQALQAASVRDIADAQARADQQIAALNRSAKAQAATAAATIAIQAKLAADRLAIIQKNEADVLTAVSVAADARARVQRAQGVNEKQIAAEIAKIRIDALAPILAQYQAHYNALVQLAQGHLTKINAIEQERIDFNRGVEKTLFDIRIGSLSALDQYAAKVKEIDKLISDARQAGVEGDIASAKKFTDQAIALSQTLKEVVNKDGIVIVSAFEAQQKAISEIKKASDGYNTSLDQQDKLAKEGLDATRAGIDAVVPKIEDLQKRYDDLKASIGAGVVLQVKIDEESLAEVQSALDRLTVPRTVPITAIFTGPGGSAPESAPVPGFAGGGRVIDAVNRFTGGAFRSPTWTKVPGVGNADIVPAALQTGSFVLRKSASTFYGDGALSKMARGYADGGVVSNFPENYWVAYKDTIAKLRALQEASIGSLRPFSPYMGMGDWAAKTVDEFVFFSKGHREEIKKLLDLVFEGWISGIASARSLNIPLTMELGLSALLGRYAQGGDVVPALLTPGEFVFSPKAVETASRTYGPDFLPALNAMQIPKGHLDNILNFPVPRPASVARFSEGGPVGYTQASATVRGAGSSGNATNITLNVYTQRFDEAELHRSIIPGLRKAMKRSA